MEGTKEMHRTPTSVVGTVYPQRERKVFVDTTAGPALKDSGERRTYATGAQRDRGAGKGAPSLVPSWVVWLVSRVYEDGAAKYSSRNWEKGMPLGEYLDSAERHLAKLKAGMRDEPHASQVVWNMLGYIFTATLIKMGLRPSDLNNMPDQINSDPTRLAEPLSPYEYESFKTFFGVKRLEDIGQRHQEMGKAQADEDMWVAERLKS